MRKDQWAGLLGGKLNLSSLLAEMDVVTRDADGVKDFFGCFDLTPLRS